jgi:hypothetical protein
MSNDSLYEKQFDFLKLFPERMDAFEERENADELLDSLPEGPCFLIMEGGQFPEAVIAYKERGREGISLVVHDDCGNTLFINDHHSALALHRASLLFVALESNDSKKVHEIRNEFHGSENAMAREILRLRKLQGEV